MKKIMLGLGIVGTSVAALAEGDTTTPSAVLETTLNSVQTTLTGYVTTALPIIGAVVVAGLAVWALPKIVRWIKSGFGR